MRLTQRIKLVLAENPKQVLPGVKVSLYDRDERDADDLLGTDVTDAKGEIFFNFDDEQYKDAEDQPEWRTESLPDYYIVIYDGADNKIYSTRSDTQRDKMPAMLTIPISSELVVKHGLGKGH